MPQFVSKYIDTKYIIGYTDFSAKNHVVLELRIHLFRMVKLLCLRDSDFFYLFSILMTSAQFIPTRINIREQNEVSVAHQVKNCMKLFVATKLVLLSTIRSWWSSLSVGCGTGSFWRVRGSWWRRKIRGARGVVMATSRGGGGGGVLSANPPLGSMSFLFLTTV